MKRGGALWAAKVGGAVRGVAVDCGVIIMEQRKM